MLRGVLIAVGVLLGLARPVYFAYAAGAVLVALGYSYLARRRARDTQAAGTSAASPGTDPFLSAATVTGSLAATRAGSSPAERMPAQRVSVAVVAFVVGLALAGIGLGAVAVVGTLQTGSAAPVPRLALTTATARVLRRTVPHTRQAIPVSVEASYSLSLTFDGSHSWRISPDLALRRSGNARTLARVVSRLLRLGWTSAAAYTDVSGQEFLSFTGPRSRPIAAATPSLFDWTPTSRVDLSGSVARNFPIGADSYVNVEAPNGLVGDTDPQAQSTAPLAGNEELTKIPIDTGAQEVDVTLLGAPIRDTPKWLRELIMNNLIGVLIPGGVVFTVLVGLWKGRRKKNAGGAPPQPATSAELAAVAASAPISPAPADPKSPRAAARTQKRPKPNPSSGRRPSTDADADTSKSGPAAAESPPAREEHRSRSQRRP